VGETCRRELLDRTLIWNRPHLLHTTLREFEQFYSEHRPHQGMRCMDEIFGKGSANQLQAHKPKSSHAQPSVAPSDQRRSIRPGGTGFRHPQCDPATLAGKRDRVMLVLG
jgi:hypothetical protein